MNIVIQAGDLLSLKEALISTCQKVRFGSEFCMYDIPSLDTLEKAYNLTIEAGKKFVYVTPRLSDKAIETIRKHLRLLSVQEDVEIVVNDLGTIRILREYPALRLHLGRQLIYTPSRSPWKTNTEHPVNIFTQRKVNEIFYQTSLNYKPTLEMFKKLGALGVDVDWIPEIFPNLSYLINNKLQVSVNLHSIPVTITRKCHTARFLGEEDLDTCSRPCHIKAYFMQNQTLEVDLYLNGNTVFRLKEPTKKMISLLNKQGVNELVLSLNPLTKSSLQTGLGSFINTLQENM
jgi:hypothetical protein